MNFKIWSFEKQAWWKASGRGYTTKRAEAGVYSIQDLGKYNLIDWQDSDTPQDEGLVMVGESEAGVSRVGRA
jgi:hypothetical protein